MGSILNELKKTKNGILSILYEYEKKSCINGRFIMIKCLCTKVEFCRWVNDVVYVLCQISFSLLKWWVKDML